jgi:hypothetical protein
MSEPDVRGRGALCTSAEGQGRDDIPVRRLYAVNGGAALLPRACGHVLLFSAKALLENRRLGQCASAADQAADGVRSVPQSASPGPVPMCFTIALACIMEIFSCRTYLPS